MGKKRFSLFDHSIIHALSRNVPVCVKQIKKRNNLATLLILTLKAINLMDDEHNKHYY